MLNDQVFVAIRLQDDKTIVLGFVMEGRGTVLPAGAYWTGEGHWSRLPTTANVDAEIGRAIAPIIADTQRGFRGPVVSWHFVDRGELPTRAYRNAWRHNGAHVHHHMPAARDEHRARLRTIRQQKLPDLDGQWFAAFGKGDKAKVNAVEAKRVKWRDAPSDARINAAQTVEHLLAIPAPDDE